MAARKRQTSEALANVNIARFFNLLATNARNRMGRFKVSVFDARTGDRDHA
jgi:predicted kinase